MLARSLLYTVIGGISGVIPGCLIHLLVGVVMGDFQSAMIDGAIIGGFCGAAVGLVLSDPAGGD